MHADDVLMILVIAGIALALPITMIVLLFRIRSTQEEHRQEDADRQRRLVAHLCEIEGRLDAVARAVVAKPGAPAAEAPVAAKAPAAPIPVVAESALPAPAAPPAVVPAKAPQVPPPLPPRLPVPGGTPAVPSPAKMAALPCCRQDAGASVVTATPSHGHTATPVSAGEEPGAFELAAKKILSRVWNWLVVGEEFRRPGVSMEQAVATTWLMRAAILLFVVAVGIGLKYSIDHGILGPAGRVALSLMAGAGMVAGGLPLLNKRYHIAGQGLIGGGLAVLYFGLFASFTLYNLLPMPLAFGLMALVTVAAGVIAVRFNSLFIAILGILGGYGTPLMLSTGEENFIGLFSYLLLLGGGVLGIARLRQWHLLNILAMACTYVLYFGAVNHEGFYAASKFWSVLPFLLAFFALFSTVMFVYNLRRREPSTLVETIALLANAAVVFYAGNDLIRPQFGREWVAALTAGLGAFYIGHAWLFLSRRLKDRPLLFCFLGLAAFFLTVTAPLLLSGGWITASWAVLALVMAWMGARLGSRFLSALSNVVYLLVLARFGIDLHREFGDGVRAGLTAGDYLLELGARLAQFGIPVACFAGSWFLSRRQPEQAGLAVAPENDLKAGLPAGAVGSITLGAGCVLLFVYAQFELYRMCDLFYEPLRVPSLTLVWVAACAALLVSLRRLPSAWRVVLLAVLGALTALKLLAVDLGVWEPAMSCYGYAGTYDAADALVRLFDFGLVVAFFAVGFRLLYGNAVAEMRRCGILLGVLSLGLLFVYLTLETSTALRDFQPALRPGGVSLLWAVFALSLVFAGIVKGVRALRLAGLALFAVVTAKLYFHDLRDMSQIFRVMVLALIGVAMFFGSLFYQKYQKRLEGTGKPDDEGG